MSSNPWPKQLSDPDDLPQDRRNLIDPYKYWSEEAVIADLDTRRHQFVVLCENLAYDFNISTVVRNANAFLAAEVWICGRRQWDKRGAVGTHKYQHMRFSPDAREVVEEHRERGYEIIAVDQTKSALNLHGYSWPEKSLMVFGQEQIGISPWLLQAADQVVFIPQWGSTRSINVGVASGLAMNSWAMQHAS